MKKKLYKKGKIGQEKSNLEKQQEIGEPSSRHLKSLRRLKRSEGIQKEDNKFREDVALFHLVHQVGAPL